MSIGPETTRKPGHLQSADLRGATRLAIRAISDISLVAEALHAAILRSTLPFAATPGGQTRGITGLSYRAVRQLTRRIGSALDVGFARLARAPGEAGTSTVARSAALAVLNGVLGDHLAATRNPLAIRMSLRHDGRPLLLERTALAMKYPHAPAHLVVLAHGLCMNDLQWARKGHDHGAALARDLACTPLYLHYNSGLPIALNGRRFDRLLQTLVEQWPVPVQRLSIIGHSMGGLVARSACRYADAARHDWRDKLDAIVFLGTPHRGAPLERGGHWFETLLQVSPYSAPFARLGKIRSAGITDLRHGMDDAQLAMLPSGVRCLAIAATLGRRRGDLKDRLLAGDGLVPLASALGRGTGTQAPLFARDSQWISYETGHLGLLDRPDVYRQILQWLAR